MISVIILLTCQITYGEVISENRAIKIHDRVCSTQKGFTKSVYERNIQIDFDDVFMEYNISSTLQNKDGDTLICSTSVAQSGKVETVDVAKVPMI